VKIGLELALLLEPRLSTRIEHRVLIVIWLAIPQCELCLARSLLLCKLLLKRPFLLWRSDGRSGFRLFFFGGRFPIALRRFRTDDEGKDVSAKHAQVVGTHDWPIVIVILPFPFVLSHLRLAGYGTSRRVVLGTLCPDGSATNGRIDIETEKRGDAPQSDIDIVLFSSACERETGNGRKDGRCCRAAEID